MARATLGRLYAAFARARKHLSGSGAVSHSAAQAVMSSSVTPRSSDALSKIKNCSFGGSASISFRSTSVMSTITDAYSKFLCS